MAGIPKSRHPRSVAGEIQRRGSIRGIHEAPLEIRTLLGGARDIAWPWHVLVQAAFQQYTDNGVSKTVNLPGETDLETVKKIFLSAHELGCKGLTVFRDGCRGQQVLTAKAELGLPDRCDFSVQCHECG